MKRHKMLIYKRL